MKTKTFETFSYLAQVKHLRRLAEKAAAAYSIHPLRLDFINHGENSTFKITDANGEKYLLRIHRRGYHSTAALRAELEWLKRMSKTGMGVQVPVPSRDGRLTISVQDPVVGERQCDLLQWREGRFLAKSISEKDLFKIGVLLAKIQKSGLARLARHRRYWTSEGLIGKNPKFGAIDRLEFLSRKEQSRLTSARRKTLLRLKKYERKFPGKMGLIHADLHFGNLLKTRGEIVPIDFDDCGYGFHMYDLAIPLVGAEYHLRKNGRFGAYPGLKKALLAGYSSVTPVTDADRRILSDLIVARKMLMIGWLRSRSDHPVIRKRLVTYARQTIRYIEKPYL